MTHICCKKDVLDCFSVNAIRKCLFLPKIVIVKAVKTYTLQGALRFFVPQYNERKLIPYISGGGCTGRSRCQPGAVNVQGLPLFLRKDMAGYEPRNRIRK